MNRPALHEPTLLEELELRQNDVLDQLDDLERRVEALLNDYLQARSAPSAAEG